MSVFNNTVTGCYLGLRFSNVGTSGQPAQITNNVITGGNGVLELADGFYTVSGNQFSGSGYKIETKGSVDASYSGNTIDWTGLKGIAFSGTIGRDTTWTTAANLNQPYVITDDLTINALLTIEPGGSGQDCSGSK